MKYRLITAAAICGFIWIVAADNEKNEDSDIVNDRQNHSDAKIIRAGGYIGCLTSEKLGFLASEMVRLYVNNVESYISSGECFELTDDISLTVLNETRLESYGFRSRLVSGALVETTKEFWIPDESVSGDLWLDDGFIARKAEYDNFKNSDVGQCQKNATDQGDAWKNCN